MVSVSVRYLFYQPMDEKIKTWTLRFPAKENPNMEKALFDWPIVLQYDVKAKYRLISRKFSGMKFFSKATRVCIRSINQSNRSISVLLLFLFCSRVFISKLYENRSNSCKTDMLQMSVFLHNSYTSHSLTHSHLTNTSPFTNLRVKEFYFVAV